MSFEDDITIIVDRILSRRPANVIRAGVISSTSPLEVIIWGDTVSVPAGLRNSAYTPAAADKVILLHIPPQLVVWGKVIAS